VVAGLAIVSAPAGAAVLVAHKAGDGALQTDSASGTVRFGEDGRVVEQRDYWSMEPGRRPPNF